MDWIKVLNKHILLEYNDLRDSEFAAWIKIMALTAQLEHEPSRQQMLKYVHYKTLDSLQDKLNKHSTTLQYVLNKVLIDAQYVLNRRESWKLKKQQYRADNKTVSKDVSMDVSSKDKEIDKEKDKSKVIKKENRGFIIPDIEGISAYCMERKNQINPQTFLNHYTGNGWMVGKNKMKNWQAVIRTWESRGGSGNERGNRYSGSKPTAPGAAGRAQSDGRPYPIDAEY